MRAYDIAIDEHAAARINTVLHRFLEESSAVDALLIDRSGQLLAQGGSERDLDTMSLCALAAGAFSSTAAMARLLGEPEFTMLFHQAVNENIHVTAADASAVLLALFGRRAAGRAGGAFAQAAPSAV